jgi:2,5-diamino-6-(ribosylamino)-4(3H)-pyrimidinone 5'-phosphate reductase
MSLDGKIATWKGRFRFSSIDDLKRVHRLRSKVDAIMVGLRTVQVDNPKLTVKYARGRNPTRIVVDTFARTPLSSHIVKTASQIPTIIAVSKKAPLHRIRSLEKAGVTILFAGRQRLVVLPVLMKRLHRLGIRTILLEGGGTLNWNMLRQGLVDEVSVAISPQIVGGKNVVTLVEGEGAATKGETIKLRLAKARQVGRDLVLNYQVLGRRP